MASDVQRAMQIALDHHQQGRTAEAEVIYRQILSQDPNHGDALHLLGVLLGQRGQWEPAVESIRRAIARNPTAVTYHNDLGELLQRSGRMEEAVSAFQRAIQIDPSRADTYNNLGNALNRRGRIDEAIAAYRQAIALHPRFPEAHYNLGNALTDKGDLDAAFAVLHQAIAIRPDFAEAHNNLGCVLVDKGELDAAIASFRQAIASRPDFAEAHCNLGNVLMNKEDYDSAIAEYHQAIALKPNYAIAYSNLGDALKEKGRPDEAIASCRHAIAIKPDLPDAHYNLGNALQEKEYSDDAIDAYHRAIALKPSFPKAYNNLGNVLKATGQLDEAIAAYRQVITLDPDLPKLHSNLVLALHYHPDCDAKTLAEEHRRWNRQHAEPLKKFIRPHTNDRNPDRRLRIGYVSPDMRQHAVGRFLLPLLAQHDKSRVEVYAYAQVRSPDAMTERLRSYTDAWRSIVGLSDAEAADRIRQDRIDILVDLALHTAHNRLLIFARKPAPVQVTYLAYAGTSGLSTMDYRLSDFDLDPPGEDDSCYSEKTIRLSQGYWCYEPPENSPPVSDPPALAGGPITFGCLNNFCKISPPTLSAWKQILHRMPGSRLVLFGPLGNYQQTTLKALEVEPDRVRFVTVESLDRYLGRHREIDIALDPFPYNGGTTTCDALWMGVAVVSLRGRTAVGRAGVSLLNHVGLSGLIAESPEQYVEIAVGLANDLPRLAEIRRTLRDRMRSSPLMDAVGHARAIESAHRQMWKDWCRSDQKSKILF